MPDESRPTSRSALIVSSVVLWLVSTLYTEADSGYDLCK